MAVNIILLMHLSWKYFRKGWHVDLLSSNFMW